MATQIDDCCTKTNPRSCLLSGFTTLVRFPPSRQKKVLTVETRAEFKANEYETIAENSIEFMHENPVIKASISACEVVICMACWESDEDNLKRQIESIKAQTLTS